MDRYQDLNWAMSELSANLVTLKDMTPAQAKRAREDALSLGAAWKWDRCKCGERYSVLSPECGNYREHELVAGRLEKERETELVGVG